MGPSGSGKSTLMHVCAGLDSVTSGRVFVGDTDLTTLKDNDLTMLRREALGFVFQSYNLVPTLTALENITLPMDIAGRTPDREWLDKVIDTIGLRDRLQSSTERAVRWPAATGRVCARIGVTAEGDICRRTHWQPRLTLQRRGSGFPSPFGR